MQPMLSSPLPEPDAQRAKHCQLVYKHILDHITKHHNQITFADFMNLALYAPNLGYYSNPFPKFGQAGDFITAPEQGSLFAQTLVTQFQQIIAAYPQCNAILEFGAGSGKLARDILKHAMNQQLNLDHYYILEPSATLQCQQQQTIRQSCPELFSKVTWLTSLPDEPLSAIVIANEVLDAFPCHRLYIEDEDLFEYYVSQKANEFTWKIAKASPQVSEAIDRLELQPLLSSSLTAYTTEINLLISPWLKTLDSCLKQAVIFIIDYGFPSTTYYHPDRSMGTLMCHLRHYAHSNPLIYPGIQDITSHVNFSHIALVTEHTAFSLLGYTELAHFLVNCAIINELNMPSISQKQELLTLTSPAEMGELFKVMALGKQVNLSLIGFEQLDKSHRL